MKLDPRDFRVPANTKVELNDWPTIVKPFFKSKKDYRELLDAHREELNSLQNLLYADNRYSLLLIFQAMDAAGKDGAIKHVMSGVNPQGCQVFSFKHPSADEKCLSATSTSHASWYIVPADDKPREILPSHLEGRTTKTFPEASRRPGEELEIQQGRHRGKEILGQLYGRI